jgi:plasmid stability protein
MSALTIRNLPDEVHDALRRVAAQRRMSVESLARQALCELARTHAPAGIDFVALHQHRAALGFAEDGPAWGEALDDGALSRRVLGLD